MDLISQYDIPFLHPLAVHFPLVLLLLGAASAGLYLLLGRAVWRQAGFVLFLLGTLGAWAAGETGHELKNAVDGDPMVELIVGRHEDGAEWTLWMSALATFLFALVSAARLPRTRAEADARAALGAPAGAAARPRRGGAGCLDRPPRRPHGLGRAAVGGGRGADRTPCDGGRPPSAP